MANLFCLSYDRWYLNGMGDWDFDRHEEEFTSEEVRDFVASNLLTDRKVSNGSVKCFLRVITDEEFKKIQNRY